MQSLIQDQDGDARMSLESLYDVVPLLLPPITTGLSGIRRVPILVACILRMSDRSSRSILVVRSRGVVQQIDLESFWFLRPLLNDEWTAIGQLLNNFQPEECKNYLANSGYGPPNRDTL